MRHESQHHDNIVVEFEVVIAGAPVPGLAPTCLIRRNSDGQFYQAPGWGAGPVAIPMPEPDPANFPGQYAFTLNPVDLDFATGAAGYMVKIVEGATPIVEHLRIDVEWSPSSIAEQVWKTDVVALVTNNQNLAANILYLVRNSLVCIEDGAVHLCNNPHPGGTRFYAGSVPPPVARDASFAGRLAVFKDVSVNDWELVRIQSLGNDGNDYFEITMLDGSSGVPGGIEANDELIVLNTNDPAIQEIMSAPMSSYSTDGTFGDWIRRTLSLRQNNMRVVWTAWNAAGVPTAGLVLIYNTKADLLADSSPWALSTGKYTIAQTFDGSGRPTAYTSVKDA